MILVAVGTHRQPFDRLIWAVDRHVGEDAIVQYGHSRKPERARAAVRFLPYAAFLAELDAADAVVTHGGCGVLLAALDQGHVPVVVPRQRRFGEHVDDHQLELGRRLDAMGKAVLLLDTSGLRDVLAGLPPRRPVQPRTRGSLHQALRETLLSSPDPGMQTGRLGGLPRSGDVLSRLRRPGRAGG